MEIVNKSTVLMHDSLKSMQTAIIRKTKMANIPRVHSKNEQPVLIKEK